MRLVSRKTSKQTLVLPLNILTLMSLGSGVLILGLLGMHNIAGPAVFAILYGFFSGAALSLLSPSLASLNWANDFAVALGRCVKVLS